MIAFIRFLAGFFYNRPDSPSMKRLCGLLCVVFLCMAMYKDTFVKGNTNPSTILIQTVGLLAFGCLGLTAAEKIAANFNDNKSNINGKSNTNP